MTYSEKLRDPRWQKTRLEIMSRDRFQCVKCFSETTTLTVHHFYYISGREPWEYPSESMHTLCRDCHTEGHDNSCPRPAYFSSWEHSACFEIGRQIQMSIQETDHDEGCLFFIERAGVDAGWPPFVVMHLLKEAAESGVMNEKWLLNLRAEIRIYNARKDINQ